MKKIARLTLKIMLQNFVVKWHALVICDLLEKVDEVYINIKLFCKLFVNVMLIVNKDKYF